MKRVVRVGVLGLQLVLALAFAATASAWRDVSIYDWGFYPGTVSVDDEAVQFTNQTDLPRQVISDEGLFDSGAIPPGGGFSLRLGIPGRHPYRSANGAMTGSIDVPRLGLTGPADDLAADHIPDLAFPAAADGDRAEDPELGILASKTRILVTFVPGTTVAGANQVLGWASVKIIGGIPDLGVLLVEAPNYGGEGEGEGGSSPWDFEGRDNALDTLRSDDRIEAAAKDLDLEPKAVPRPATPFSLAAGPTANWTWGNLGPANELYAGDNWYLEADRAPQAWNLLQAIKSKNATVLTGVIDDVADKAATDLTGVQNHQFCQTVYLVFSRCTELTPGDHGTHVAGTIGGAWDDNAADGPITRQPNATGIDGINPVAKLHSVGDTFQGGRRSYADELTIFDSVLDEVRPGGSLEHLRAINYSVAFPPLGLVALRNRHATADCGPGAADDGQASSTQDCSMENDDVWLTDLANVGPIARLIAERASDLGVIIVQAAGNESNDFCVPLSADPSTCPTFAVISGESSGEFIWASKRWTSPKTNPIIGVEAIGDSQNSLPGLMRAEFSNDGGDISAPGVGIVSTGTGGTFKDKNGTSMAAPQVTGAITYLLAYKPDLTIAEVKSALLDWARADTTGNAAQSPTRTPQPRLDLFASLLSLPGAAKELVDVNDRTKDGNQRVERHATPPHPTLATQPIKPDGKIDMRDFRAFRDAWLQGCAYTPADTSCPTVPEVVLDGGPAHGKKDANLDGCVAAQPPVAACPTPENVFSRFDFNGDGKLDRLPARFPVDQSGSPAGPPGAFMTDLNVLMSAFEASPDATEGWTKSDLSTLMQSGDLEIHADDLLDRGAGDVEISITADGVPQPTRHLKPTGDRTKDFIVATVPSFKSLEIKGTATIGGEKVESATRGTQLFDGEDERVDLCQRLSLVAKPGRVPADGSSTAKLVLDARKCKDTDVIAGKPITWAIDKSSASLTQTPANTGSGSVNGVFTAGNTTDTYKVTATVDFGNGETETASVDIVTTPKLTITYLWRQSIDEWHESGSTRWTAPPPGLPDCTLAGVEYCLDNFEIHLESQAAGGIARSGTLAGGGSSFKLTEQLTNSLTTSRATWTVAKPDGSTENGEKLSNWQVIDPNAYVDAPVDGLASDDAADGLHVQGLQAVGDLPYHYALFGGLAGGTIDPVEVHAARTETLLIPQGVGNEIRFAAHPEQEIVFPRNPDGTLAPFQSCGVKDEDLTTTFGYRVASDGGTYLPGAISIGRKTSFAPGDRPMPVGPGRLHVTYAFAAVASYGGAPGAAPILPDCAVPHPPVAAFTGPATADEGRQPRFRDRSTDVDNDIEKWAWDFGDGEPGQTGPNPHHIFPDNGTYTVTLTVTDAKGLTDSAQQQIVVSNLPPEGHIEDAQGQQGAPTSVTWGMVDLGKVDKTQLVWSITTTKPGIAPLGGTDAAQEGSLEFPATVPAGIYPLVLKVTDKDGGSTTAEATLTITPGPVPACDPLTGQNCPPPAPPTVIVCDPGVSLDAEETNFLNFVNAYRIQSGVPPLLGVSPTLTKAAEEHAHDMAVNDYMAHTGLDGRGPGERAWDALYPKTASVGENLATDSSTGFQAFFAWRASTAGHNENMLNPAWKAIGIAREQGNHWRWATSYGTALDCPPATPAPAARASSEPETRARADSLEAASSGEEASDVSLGAAASDLAPTQTGAGVTVVEESLAEAASTEAEASGAAASSRVEQARFLAAAAAAPPAEPPIPAFTVSDVTPLELKPITFTNVSRDAAGTPIGATLDFGDGAAAAVLGPGESVSHRYGSSSYLKAALTATDAGGRSLSVDRWLYIESLPTPTLFYTGDTQGFVGKNVTLRALAKTWYYGTPVAGLTTTFTIGGITATAVTGADGQAEATVTLTGIAAGFYNVFVSFAGSDDYKATSTAGSLQVFVNTLPVAEAGGPYLSGIGNALVLDGSRSRDVDSGDSVVSHAWDLDGDGAYDDLLGGTPLPLNWASVQATVCGGTCLTAHDYTVGLKVTDTRGDASTDTATVRFTSDFALFLGGEGKTIVPGASNSFAVTVVGSDGFTEPVALSVEGLPAAVTGTFSVNPAPPGSVSVLTITAGQSAETGSFPIIVTGTAGGITHTVSDEVKVAFGLIPICYGTISGGVTDVETGAPVAGVGIFDNYGPTALTDANGRFTLHNVALGYYNAPVSHYLTARKGGYWESSESTTAYCGATSSIALTVQQKRQGHFSGKVVEGTVNPADPSQVVPTTTPIAGASVGISYYGPSLTTGADGTYAGDAELNPGNQPAGYGVRAMAPGYWEQDKYLLADKDTAKTLDFELVKQCTGKVRGGRVLYLDPDGNLTGEVAANHSVKLWITPYNFVFLQSDAEGRFDFNRTLLLAYNNGPISYNAVPVPNNDDPPGSVGVAQDLTIGSCGDEAHGDVWIKKGFAGYSTFEGFVYDEETGAPVADAFVANIYEYGGGAVTDSTGHFRAENIFLGFLQTTAYRYPSATKEGYYTSPYQVVLLENGKTATANYRIMKKRTGALAGSVTDVTTGAPIPSATVTDGGVYCYPSTICAGTDRNGNYSAPQVALGNRNAAVAKSVTAFATDYWSISQVTTIEADKTSRLDYRLLRKCTPARIVGSVVNANTQAPIGGAQVTGGSFPVYTNAEGRFQIDNIQPGFGNNPTQVYLTASASGFFSQSKVVTIFCGATIAVDFGTRQTSLGILVGRVTNADSGNPMPGVFVGTEFGGSATTDANGDYRIVGVPLGDLNADKDWRVTVAPSGFKPQTKIVTAKANVEARADFSFSLASNQVPAALAQSVSLTEDTSSFPITLAGSDLDSDPLTFGVMTFPQHGTLTVSGASVSYRPDRDYHGADSFTFAVNDGQDTSPHATVSITVDPVNDQPIAEVDNVTTNEDTPLAIPIADILANDRDVDGDTLSLTAVLPHFYTFGDAVISGDNVLYTPAAGFSGTANFRYEIGDGNGAKAQSNVYITVLHVAGPPSCPDASFSGTEDQPLTGAVACTDGENDPLTYSVVAGPSHGSLSFSGGGTFTYVPQSGYAGPDSFTFKANDGTADSRVATASLTIAATNAAPTAANDTYTTNEDTTLVVAAPGLLGNDADADGDALSTSPISLPVHGSLTYGTDGSFTYVPNANYSGPDAFSYAASDGTLLSPAATVSITVAPVNDAPVAQDAAVSTNEDAPVSIGLAATDVDGDALGTSVVIGPAHGSLSGSGATRTYTPDPNYSGPDAFTYRASDGALDSNVATISITVTPVNDAPAADASSVSTDEDTAVGVTLSGSDVEGDPLSFRVEGPPTHGRLSGSGASLTYTPDPNYNGPDSFGYRAGDGVAESAVATVSITVAPVNDAPVADAKAVSTDEETSVGVTLSGSDVDGDALGFQVLTEPAHGTLAGSGAARTYTPDPNYNGPDSFTYQVDDGALASAPALVSLTVTPVNDTPVADDKAVTTPGGAPVALTLSGSDPDGDTLTFSVATDPAHGVLTGSPPSLVYTPVSGFSGTDSFTYRASDGAASSLPATVTVTVGPAPPPTNRPPVVTLAPAGPVDEGNTVALAASASDPDGDALTYRWTADTGTIAPAGATAVLAADDGPATVHVVVTVSDGHDHVVTDSQVVTVRNLPPSVTAGAPAVQPWGVPVTFAGVVADPSQADVAAGLRPRWSFGDGAGADGIAASHPYDAPGSYIATLSATDKDGGSGSAATAVTITKRPTTLAYTGDTCSVFGFTALSARLTDGLNGGGLAGRTITFDVAGVLLDGVTDANGVVKVVAGLPLPSGAVGVAFSGDSRYVPAAAAAQLRIVSSTGKVTGGGVRSANQGRGGFNVDGGKDGVKGELQWQKPGLNFHAHRLTAVGIAPDGRSAWFAGVGIDGRPFTAAVEDRGEPGRNDRFRLWIAGVLQTPADGAISGGNVQIHTSGLGQAAACGGGEAENVNSSRLRAV